jgi:7-cyano-7-deazaguanine synthase in queuosine biosynthesis
MATYKNWLTTNVLDRDSVKASDLKVTLSKIDEWNLNLDFVEATKYTIEKIALLKKRIFIGLSGGMDSEYVCKAFLQEHVDFTPVIIETPGNSLELSYAYHFCRKNNLEPIIIKKSEADMLKCYYNDILNRISGYGNNATATYMAAKYAEDHNGIFVMAEHLIDDQDDGSILIGANEWDFYNDVLIGEHNTHYFFDYTPEIVYSMVKAIDIDDAQEYKCNLYDIPFRPKMIYQYSREYEDALKQLRRTKWIKHNPNFSFGTKEEFLSFMEKM